MHLFASHLQRCPYPLPDPYSAAPSAVLPKMALLDRLRESAFNISVKPAALKQASTPRSKVHIAIPARRTLFRAQKDRFSVLHTSLHTQIFHLAYNHRMSLPMIRSFQISLPRRQGVVGELQHRALARVRLHSQCP